jgi:hypothetical protein
MAIEVYRFKQFCCLLGFIGMTLTLRYETVFLFCHFQVITQYVSACPTSFPRFSRLQFSFLSLMNQKLFVVFKSQPLVATTDWKDVVLFGSPILVRMS